MTITAPNDQVAGSLFVDDLAVHGQRIAVRTATQSLTYADLDERVVTLARQLGPERRLVLAGGANTVDALVAYLAALRGGHPVLLAPGGDDALLQSLMAAYDPDVVLQGRGDWTVTERRAGTAHALHPDLALLLPTSGTTGSSKLVRLSRLNVQANATAIAQYLGLGAEDRAITTLPLHYCYGLSVVHSHLLAGAGLVLTDLSVVDRCFWDLFRAAGATSFAGVPHTFDLLDRVGFPDLTLPTLRQVTQAGGRLHPDQVRRYAALGERDGWDLFVMYGQTEATARMAYLPPALARRYPHAIGIAIPGGSLTVEHPDHDGVGELVYEGPNVMLGYAETASDLAAGPALARLHTGDLARVDSAGLLEIVGRRSRFVKPYGVRIDLDGLERRLADHGIAALCTGDDDLLVVAVAESHDGRLLSRLLGDLGLPAVRICLLALADPPRLANAKPDYLAILGLGRAAHAERAEGAGVRPAAADGDARRALRQAYATVLGREPADHQSFVDLGGDSLSYVEVSVRLEQALGVLPPDWHVTPVGQLPAPPAAQTRRSRAVARVDTTVLLRAVAIVLIVGTHTKLWFLPGGAHTLLGVAGFNFARFHRRPSTLAASIARVAIPALGWVGLMAATTDQFTWRHALLLNVHLEPTGSHLGYWFIESLLQIVVPLALLLSIPAVRRLERRQPFLFPMALAGAGLAVRFGVLDLPSSRHGISRPWEVLWLFALGWAAARAGSWGQRLAVSALVVWAIPGFFGLGQRELFVAAGLLAVVWVRTVPVPRPLNRMAGTLAGASLFIYLTHFQVAPPLVRAAGPASAAVASVVVGIAAASAARRITRAVEDRFRPDGDEWAASMEVPVNA